MAFGGGLAQYYNIGRQGISKQYERIGEASQKWGDILGQLAEAGTGAALGAGAGNKKLKEEYEAYSTAEIDAERTPMDFDVWKSQNKDRVLKEFREANKVEREERRDVLQAEKEYGVKQPGVTGLLQRVLPGGQSGYGPVGPYAPSDANILPVLGDVPVVNPNINSQVQGGGIPIRGPLGNLLNPVQQNVNQNYYGNLYPGSSLYQTQD